MATNQLFIDMINSRLNRAQAQRDHATLRTMQHKAQAALKTAFFDEWSDYDCYEHDRHMGSERLERAQQAIMAYVQGTEGSRELWHLGSQGFIAAHRHDNWAPWTDEERTLHYHDIGICQPECLHCYFDQDRDGVTAAFWNRFPNGNTLQQFVDFVREYRDAHTPVCACGQHCGGICHDAQVAYMEHAEAELAQCLAESCDRAFAIFDPYALLAAMRAEPVSQAEIDEIPF